MIKQSKNIRQIVWRTVAELSMICYIPAVISLSWNLCCCCSSFCCLVIQKPRGLSVHLLPEWWEVDIVIFHCMLGWAWFFLVGKMNALWTSETEFKHWYVVLIQKETFFFWTCSFWIIFEITRDRRDKKNCTIVTSDRILNEMCILELSSCFGTADADDRQWNW